MQTLLEMVQQQLDSKRITVAYLATACGVSRQYIYQMLKGHSHPTVPVAEKLASAIGAEITVKKTKARKISA